MKALSIQQPWAWAILHAGKDIENRTWPTRYTGSIYIHAGKKFDYEGYRWILEKKGGLFWVADIPSPSSYNFGGIVGIIDIVDCVDFSHSPWFFGPWGFVLKNARAIDFIPYKGKLGLFDVTAPS